MEFNLAPCGPEFGSKSTITRSNRLAADVPAGHCGHPRPTAPDPGSPQRSPAHVQRASDALRRVNQPSPNARCSYSQRKLRVEAVEPLGAATPGFFKLVFIQGCTSALVRNCGRQLCFCGRCSAKPSKLVWAFQPTTPVLAARSQLKRRSCRICMLMQPGKPQLNRLHAPRLCIHVLMAQSSTTCCGASGRNTLSNSNLSAARARTRTAKPAKKTPSSDVHSLTQTPPPILRHTRVRAKLRKTGEAA